MVAKDTKCSECRKQIDMPGKCYTCATGRPRLLGPGGPVHFRSDWSKEGKKKKSPKPITTAQTAAIETAA